MANKVNVSTEELQEHMYTSLQAGDICIDDCGDPYIVGTIDTGDKTSLNVEYRLIALDNGNRYTDEHKTLSDLTELVKREGWDVFRGNSLKIMVSEQIAHNGKFK